ncbi:MAG: hypothetical protein CJBNEKGG_03785 [Prosthecobacter sp.]|nr:hypothetical protein [Prosthecobacter sp.]
MAALKTHPRLRFWLRQIVLLCGLGMTLWLLFSSSVNDIRKHRPEQLTKAEVENLELMTVTAQDLKPDFSLSFSEPLHKMAPHRSDGLVQPLWPWMAAWMGDGMDVEATLLGTGMFRLGFTLGFLILLTLVCSRTFSLATTLWLLVVAALDGFLPVMPFFTGEVFFHTALLLLWLGCIQALRRNSLWVYAMIGISAAIAWLFEDRLVFTIVGCFVLISTLRALWGWAATHFTTPTGISQWVWRNHWLGLLMMAAAFFFITGPRLQAAYERFGDAFFSHVDHVRWLSDAAAAQQWMESHPDSASLARSPALDRPSLANILPGLTMNDVRERLFLGGKIIHQDMHRVLRSFAVLTAGMLALALMLRTTTARPGHAGQRLHPETATTVIFVLLATTLCVLTALWDARVLSVRHLHALVIPLSISLVCGTEGLLHRARRRDGGRWATAIHAFTLGGLAVWRVLAHQA